MGEERQEAALNNDAQIGCTVALCIVAVDRASCDGGRDAR